VDLVEEGSAGFELDEEIDVAGRCRFSSSHRSEDPHRFHASALGDLEYVGSPFPKHLERHHEPIVAKSDTSPQDKTLEFKRDLSSPQQALRTIVAFANTAGGVLLIGVEDRTRRVLGVTHPVDMEERLASLVSDGIAPHLSPELEVVPWRRTHVVAVEVFPSSARPHHLKRLGPENGVFVRVGSTNRPADAALIGELGRSARHESYDEEPMPELDSEAIDFRAASELFAPVRNLRRGELRTLRVLTAHQGHDVPTVGGVLLFGRDRERFFPDAWIQAGRFDGTGRQRISDSVEIRSLPVAAVEDAIAFVRRNISREAVIGEVRRVDRWAFPLAAVREAVINAVVHADYSQRGGPIRIAVFDDRLEVESPGLLPFGLTVEEIRRGVSRLRNRVIGRVFHELGLIEQWGSGIGRMTAACIEAGLDEPALEELGGRFRVTLSRTAHTEPLVDDTDRNLIEALDESDGLSTSALARITGLSARATRSRLAALVERGLIVEVGTGPNDPRRRYYGKTP
jgi:predicted HTH transcriptional regulator